MSVDSRVRTLVDMDVGGTWFRARVHRPGGVEPEATSKPAPSRLRDPTLPASDLIADLLREIDQAAPVGADVAISLGAAMDETTGTVHGSGPLWGDHQGPLPLRTLLEERRPDATWHVFNDVTCGLAALSRVSPQWARQISFLTVSSGVALRTADLDRGLIEVDEWGMQGEIGHGPAVVAHPGLSRLGPLLCDCGQHGHVAAIASGPGLARAGEFLGLGPAAGFPARFVESLDQGDERAWDLLATAVRPVADTIATLWRVRPHAEFVGVGGGVAIGLGERYGRELVRQLAGKRAYSDHGRDLAWVTERVRVLGDEECNPLSGARLLADGLLRTERPGVHREAT